ncbi:hypothetical protein PSAR109036_12875 [Psychrobacter arenosus]
MIRWLRALYPRHDGIIINLNAYLFFILFISLNFINTPYAYFFHFFILTLLLTSIPANNKTLKDLAPLSHVVFIH